MRVIARVGAVAFVVLAIWPVELPKADNQFCAGPTFGNVAVTGKIWEREFPTNEFMMSVRRNGCEEIDVQVFLRGRASDYPNCVPPHSATVTGRVMRGDDVLVIRNPIGVDCY